VDWCIQGCMIIGHDMSPIVQHASASQDVQLAVESCI